MSEILAENYMRRRWLALCIGLAIAAALTVAMYTRITRPFPGGGYENLSITIAFPTLFYLHLPGIALMWLTLLLTPVSAASSHVLMQVLVTTGNTIFYGLAAYVVVAPAANWRRT
jgi:hypothetical protein